MNAVLNSGSAPALNDAEVGDVLRYWLAVMRHQEALAARPKARRQDVMEPAALAGVAPNLKDPAQGQQYAKLDWSARAAFIVTQRGQVEVELDAEARAFFEDWLGAAYRRGEEDESQRVGYLLSFPTLLLPRGELAGILRCPVELRWLDEGAKVFSVPSYKQRASGDFPAPPTRYRLTHGANEGEEVLPYFVDTRLLSEVLRIDTERLDKFFVELRKKQVVRPRAMVDAVSKLIEEQLAEDAPGGSTSPTATRDAAVDKVDASTRSIGRLQSAVARRLRTLSSRTRAYPVALIVNGDQSRATAHAQRDIAETLERLANKSLKRATPVSRYLRGEAKDEPSEREAQRCLGRFTESGLTPHQLRAAELSLSSRLSAIQGPPGTGKTTLILNRVADTLVRKVLPLLEGYAMSDAILVVTSTNNAAVDNVTTPLGSGLGPDRLPLAIRVGSRDVTERVTSADIERCTAWLERHKAPKPGEDFDSVLASFRKAYDAQRAGAAEGVKTPEQIEAEGYQLFRAAERLRAAWAIHNRKNLLNVLNLALRAARSSRSLKKLLETQGGGGPWLRRLFPAWGSTLLSLGNVFPPDVGCCEQVIIDEAGQCHPGYAVSALLRAQSALVIGDVHQLEPVIGLTEDDEKRILSSQRLSISKARIEPYRTHDDAGASAQALADRAVSERPVLVDHFRCQPAIAAICERLCNYGLVPRARPMSRVDHAPALIAPVLFAALSGEQQRHAGSWMNPREVTEVVWWVQYLIAHGIAADDIGVITPFRGQLDALWRDLRLGNVPLEQHGESPAQDNLDLFGASPGRGVAVGTVHRFQGGERSVILFSTTVTREASLRFVDERVNLLNVAASRARDHLITLGHEATLRAGRHTPFLLADARRLDAEALALR